MTEDEKPAPQKLREFLGEKLQEGFNQQSAGIGAQIVTDWLIIAEVHGTNGPVLRLLDSGLPLWRSVGLMKFGLMDAQEDLALMNSGHGDEEE